MRAKTLAADEVVSTLNRQYVIVWHNLLPELYGTADPDAGAPPTYDEQRVERLPEGAGGGNIRIYFCKPDGAVIHQVTGYWRPRRFMEEVAFAESLVDKSAEA